MTDAQRIEMNRLLRQLVREVDQAECDKIEARVRELEAGNEQEPFERAKSGEHKVPALAHIGKGAL